MWLLNGQQGWKIAGCNKGLAQLLGHFRGGPAGARRTTGSPGDP